MKVERVKIVDLLMVLVSYLRGGVSHVDIKLDEETNTLKVKPTDSDKTLPAPKQEDKDDENNNGLSKVF